MAYTPGYYMPNGYGNAYYPVVNQSWQPALPVQQPQSTAQQGIIWVDGEVGAKAYQMPSGVTGPIALWDTNDQVIYLKSMNQMGMPNPLQKIKYQMEDAPQVLPAGQQSGAQSADYATKDDLSSLRTEIQSLKEMLGNRAGTNQNGSNSQQGQNGNRGGSR